MDWIEEQRQARIKRGIPKYGAWTVTNFSKRNPLSESIDELLDAMNYIEMSEKKGQISKGLCHRLHYDLTRILSTLKINE